GPLNTFRTDGGRVIKTPFKWAKDAASKATPGPGECAWADRAPQTAEIKTGDANAITGAMGPFDNIPIGTYGKICVSWSGDGAANGNLVVRQIVRGVNPKIAPFHEPPFANDASGCPN